ncbi:MAG: DUF6885 family protein [Gaiellaceae bacterium]
MTELLDLDTEGAQQKDNLCGPFWAARLLRDYGVTEWDGEPIDEDLIALRAGTVLPEPSEGSVPPGAGSRTDYRFELPTGSPAESGTDAGALASTLEAAAGGAARCVPFRGTWTAERVEQLVGAAPQLGARLLANVRTGCFWGSRPRIEALLSELEGRPAPDEPPDWDVGHFCELAGLIRGGTGSLVLVRDSYPSFGLNAHHLQPPRVVAAGLERGDGKEGGVLAFAQADRVGVLESLAAEIGLEIGIWDNGTRMRR